MSAPTEIVLYHYTRRDALQQIEKTGIVRKSRAINSLGELVDGLAVSLTDDTDRTGHGLPDGREVTQAQASRLPPHIIKKRNKKIYLIDATTCGLQIWFNSADTNLMSATKYYPPDQKFLRLLEILGHCPGDVRLTDGKLKAIQTSFKSGRLVPKGKTWFYYFDDIDLNVHKHVFI